MPAASPEKILKIKRESIPEFVFEAFNQLIAVNVHNGISKVLQKDAVSLILAKAQKVNSETTSQDIYSKGWLDIEPFYEKAGWKVEYDKPGYNESYDAYFVFTGNKG